MLSVLVRRLVSWSSAWRLVCIHRLLVVVVDGTARKLDSRFGLVLMDFVFVGFLGLVWWTRHGRDYGYQKLGREMGLALMLWWKKLQLGLCLQGWTFAALE